MCTYVQCACTCTCICHRHGKSEATIHIEFRKDVLLPSDRVCEYTHVVRGSGKNNQAKKPRRHPVDSVTAQYSALLKANQAVPDLMKQTWQKSFAETNCTKEQVSWITKSYSAELESVHWFFFGHARNTSTSLVLCNRLLRTQSIFFPNCWQVANNFNEISPFDNP